MHKKGLLSLSPLAVFLAVYLASSIACGDFYRVPISSAFLIASTYSVIIGKGSLKEKLSSFGSGAGNPGILMMIWIFILAGAFAETAKSIGAVDATVNATLSLIPAKMLFAGLFLTSCFISMSIGTSVGTIVALIPIAAGIASQTGSSLAYMSAVIVGGAFFGDNLSFISDTTIAATQAVGCRMDEKFKANILIVIPAVIAVTVIYIFHGQDIAAVAEHSSPSVLKLIPYMLVVVLAISGLNVCFILALGIGVNAIIGICCGDFGWTGLLESIGKGIGGMNELIIVTLLSGGLLEMIRRSGGLDYLISILTAKVGTLRGAQFSIASLVSLANICTANNTIAIITIGPIANDISRKYGLPPRRAASILDTFSCIIQCLIPYGAQLLMASGLSGVPPTAIIPYLYYPFALAVCATATIVFGCKKQ